MSQRVETEATKPAGAGDRAGRPRPRRPYHSPHLECYGRLAELTQFGGSQVVDSGSGLGNQPG